jgi:Cu2+-exporting ATPase
MCENPMSSVDLSSFVRRGDDGAARLDLAVDGIDCAACIGEIEGALARLPGLLRARLNYTNHRLSIEWADGMLDPQRILERLAVIGYRAYPFSANEVQDSEARQARWLLRCLAVAGIAAMNVMLLSVSIWAGEARDITPETRDFFHWLSALVVLPAAAFAGQPFFLSAFRALRARSLNMDVPISVGLTLALGMSLIETANHAAHAYFDSAMMLIFFLLVGRYCELAMRGKLARSRPTSPRCARLWRRASTNSERQPRFQRPSWAQATSCWLDQAAARLRKLRGDP